MSVRKKAPERRWLPGVCFGVACVVLGGLLLKQFLHDSQPPAIIAPTRQNQGGLISVATNDTQTGLAGTNLSEAPDPEDRVVALVTEGNQLLARGDHAAAVERYEAAVAISPGQEDLHYNLAIGLAKSGRVDEAKKQYEEALRIYPEYAEAHNNLGNLLMNENQLEQAINRFREAITHMPENASFHNNLGTAFGRQGKPAEAIPEFEQAIQLSPAYVEARVNLANAYLATDRVDEAILQLNEALRLQPDFKPALQVMQRARQRQNFQPP